MRRYIVRRLMTLILVVLFATVAVFGALQLVPGDPAQLILGQDATPERLETLRHELGLDLPVWRQYVDFMSGLMRGDLGRSYQQSRPVMGELLRTFPVTLTLSTVAIILSVVAGVGFGVWSAVRVNTWIDSVLRIVLLTSTSVPIYWLGLLLIYAFSVYWPLLPSFGWGTPRHLILPAIALATFPLALIARLTRAATLEVLRQEYVTTARAKGLSETTVVFRHALRNALVPVVTVVGLQFGALLAGAVLTETVFSVPGMGQLLINAIFSRDYAIVRGSVLLAAVVVALINLVVDLVYLFLDPRIRYQ